MKIITTADIHGNRKIIDKLIDIADKSDLILICGDIGGKSINAKTLQQFSEHQKQGTEYASPILFLF